MCHEIQYYSCIFMLYIDALFQKFKAFKYFFDTFHPANSFFLISRFTVFLLINFFLNILWIKLDQFSPSQFLVLCLISSQDWANINCTGPLIENQLKKYKQARNIFYFKSKLNQVSVLALPDWQFLGQE